MKAYLLALYVRSAILFDCEVMINEWMNENECIKWTNKQINEWKKE